MKNQSCNGLVQQPDAAWQHLAARPSSQATLLLSNSQTQHPSDIITKQAKLTCNFSQLDSAAIYSGQTTPLQSGQKSHITPSVRPNGQTTQIAPNGQLQRPGDTATEHAKVTCNSSGQIQQQATPLAPSDQTAAARSTQVAPSDRFHRFCDTNDWTELF